MKTDARRLSPSPREEIRYETVAAVHAGMTQTKAAQVIGVARKTIWRWLNAFRAGGTEALKAHKRGPKGECTTLKGWQAGVVGNIIGERHPEQLKPPFVLWTVGAVRQLIEGTFKVRVSERTVRRYLARWGFTPQKSVRHCLDPRRANPDGAVSLSHPAHLDSVFVGYRSA